ncbi:AAA family ATPase [Cereibacter johrii]|uniref:AAA family ATPase n=1 Tax=Cereibacter johrii TaxID=445629 RepID=UPI003CF67E86
MLKLKSIGIKRFKGVMDCVLDLNDNLNLLIGPNGTGKSSILQAFSFVKSFAEGAPTKLFEHRAWNPGDIKAKANKNGNAIVAFDILLSDERGSEYFWQFSWSLANGSTRTENLWFRNQGGNLLSVFSYTPKDGLRVGTRKAETTGGVTSKDFSGSVMDRFIFSSEEGYDSELVNEWAKSILSLELLNTSDMRKNAREGDTSFGHKGEKLAALLWSLGPTARENIAGRVSRFYPLTAIETRKKRAGWVELSIIDGIGGFEVRSPHISDGVLRMIALATLPEVKGAFSIVLLDEVEDGIEPHHLKSITDDLRTDIGSQALVTSHSPVVANFMLPSEVTMISRDERACTVVTPLSAMNIFDDEHLNIGDIWMSTSTNALEKNIRAAPRDSTYPITEKKKTLRQEVEAFIAARLES